MDNAAFLRSIPLFSKLDQAELQRLGELTREKNYPKGSVIVFEDDPGDSLFIVREGRVKVVLIGEDGREVILGVLGVGEHFGELSLIDDMPRSAHVIAMEDLDFRNELVELVFGKDNCFHNFIGFKIMKRN